MDEIRRRLLVLALIMLLAGCAREATPQPQPTFQPPQAVPATGHTPTATPSVQSVDALADQETAAAPQQMTASPTPTSTAPATLAEATTTPTPQTAEPETADPASILTPLRLQNMTFSNPIVPDGEVALENGTYEAQAEPESAAQIRVELSDITAFGEVGSEHYAAVILEPIRKIN